MKRFAVVLLGSFALAGCGRPAPTPATLAEQPTIAVPIPIEPESKPKSEPVKPELKPVELPSDFGGLAVAKALRLPAPLPPDGVAMAKGPKPRLSDFDKGELPLPGIKLRPFSSSVPNAKPPMPSAPTETVPANLGGGSASNPLNFQFAERPRVKAPSPMSGTAADIPAQARPSPMAPNFDDPTAGLVAQKIIQTPFPKPNLMLPFSKVSIPDPFEFLEHLKGPLGRDPNELARDPVKVNPERK